jgi:hypothetical protein
VSAAPVSDALYDPNSAELIRQLARQWREAALDAPHPRLVRCYEDRARYYEKLASGIEVAIHKGPPLGPR